ncbi:MAG TPA: GtrA family protein [Solirubrobacteraceae bacterium]|nr:GtrA family protein [Solirubrobacteraceae bacterium]
MSEDAVAVAPLSGRARVSRGLRSRENWVALVRFALVGASGYVVNLAVFALVVHGLGADYRLGAAAAFAVAVTNNFAWNRRWTFDARDGHAGFQAARFLIVSGLAFAVSLGVLQLLVAGAAMPKLPAQATAIAVVTPFSFLGNKLWSFVP